MKGTGIEVGASAVTVVELDGSPKKFRVAAAGRAPIEPGHVGEDRVKAVAQAARAAMKAARASREQVVVSVPACDVIIREIQLPFTDEEQIKKVIKFESESHLHSCDIDDVVVGFQKISEAASRSRVLVFAVRKDEIKAALDALDRIGVDPMHVTIDAAALFSAWRTVSEGSPDGTFAILDVGDVTTTALVTVGDRIRMVRGIRLGTETIARTVASDLGLDAEDARKKAAQFADGSAAPFALARDVEEQDPDPNTSAESLQRDIIRDSHGGFAARVANEMRRSLSSVLLDGKLEGVFLTGSGCNAPGLEEALATAFHVPVKRLAILDGVDHKLPGELKDVVATAVGLGIKALGHDPLALDFRQEEFKFSRKFDRVKWALVTALSLLLFLFVFLLIHEVLDGRETARQQDIVAESARSVAHKRFVPLLADATHRKVMGAKLTAEDVTKRLETTPPDRVVADVERLVREAAMEIEKNFGFKPGDETSQDNVATSALKRLHDFIGCFKKHPELVGRFAINKLFVSANEINWNMDLADDKDWAILNECFEALPEVEKVERASVKPIGPGAQPGMVFRLENNRIIWPREGR